MTSVQPEPALRGDPTRKNVILLACCQAFSMTGNSLTMTVSAIVGTMLADDKSLATLPLAVQLTSTMLTTLPASMLMKRFGRRPGFMLGVVVGIIGALIAAVGIFQANFILFCAGAGLMGVNQGFALFYRFAAADTASEAFKSKAISLVLAGGVFSAVAGPNLAIWSRDLFEPILFAGSFATIAVIWLIPLVLLIFIEIPRPTLAQRRDSGRPLGQIIRQPVFVVAVVGAVIGYTMMNMVMTATPLAMLACGLEFSDAAFVIQWHALGMFAPAFITGSLINRYGVLNIMLTGAALMIVCVGINLTGQDITRFWFALVLLGVGWNFLFVGGTTLLTKAYLPAEKEKVQAMNDFLVFGSVSIGSFSAGALQNLYGWPVVNLTILPFVVIAISLVLWLRLSRGTASPTA
ncbi:MAG: MFS transporter [Alphaproteobacteria bacterium]|nr:MFS transporter [Alphaproteobacteria bacterium]MBU0798366.1 MFS transporter [Alphaproteobacteria bacterium]MBU0887819.1 MFS transporter [Alphaproteobacteria bacterium]MBU1814958.1 MFS transporter [Alphaproteobacteria bacterium]